MASLQELQARKSQLLAELAAVEEAITASGDSGVVQIRTWKNIRNTPFLTVSTPEYQGDLMVFADQALSIPADIRDHEGWVTKSDLASFRLIHPNMGEAVEEVK